MLNREGRIGRKKRLWRKEVRNQYILEHGTTCQWCHIDTDHLEVHHKIKRSLGGKDCPENAMVLCHWCHIKAHLSKENYCLFRDSVVSLNRTQEAE